jgi:hypothetical protein
MKTEPKIPPYFTTAQAQATTGVQADIYLRHEMPVAIVLWRSTEPQPYAAYKDSDDGCLKRFTVTSNDDVPRHDRRESRLNVRVEVFASPGNESVTCIALHQEQQAEPFLTVTGAQTPMRLYPFNNRSIGGFVNDFRDRDGLPVSDAHGATMRAVLHGRAARAWPIAQTAKLVAEYSSDQMVRLMEVVNVRSRDDEWRVRYQDQGLAGSEELASILSSRWPQTYRPADDKVHPLPLVAVEVDRNTFSFYLSDDGEKKAVRVHQFTDFRGSIIEDDFPLGSSNEWSAGMPKNFTDMEAVNAVGRTLLQNWESLPKTFPAAEAPPYDPNDMDAAVGYAQHTKELFALGDHDRAYAHYMRDPNGGAQASFSQTTKEQFVERMYTTRDVQGELVHPRPESDLGEPPLSDDAFDSYIANEGFHEIVRVEVMETFLLRAARRYHVLDTEQSEAINADQTVPGIKQKAWSFLHDQFSVPNSDLRMFFSETDDFWEHNAPERKRLYQIADLLTNSGRDPARIDVAQAIALVRTETPDLSPEHITALRSFKEKMGSTWKADLNEAWTTGDKNYWGSSQVKELKELQDVLGYKWLRTLSDEELTQGSAPVTKEQDQSTSSGPVAEGFFLALSQTAASPLFVGHSGGAHQDRPGIWRSADANDGMRFPEQSDLIGGLTDQISGIGDKTATSVDKDVLQWIGDSERSVGMDAKGHMVAIRSGNELVTLNEVFARLNDGEKGDDLPILLKEFGCDYDEACDAIFGDDHARAIALLEAASQKPYAEALKRYQGDCQHVEEAALSDEQCAAVAAFCDANGRNWKGKLESLWINGNYSQRGIDTNQAALLQQVRNQFGPEWLFKVTRADLDESRLVVRDDYGLGI